MPNSRRPYLVANWKMHKTIEETTLFLADFLPRIGEAGARDVLVSPPYPALRSAVEICSQSRIRVAAQNMHEQSEGPFTGEVSAPMLLELGVDAVILGHSERRQHFGENDDALARKLPAAIDAGLEPILCVGETEVERDAGATEAVLQRQVSSALTGVTDDRLGRVVIAYEPVWAIGTGRNATPDQAAEAIAFVRSIVAGRSAAAAKEARILYGGSVKPANAPELLAPPGVDGALVGGASLDPAAFAEIVAAA
jgi:triosephosphate isomerase (TIM)